MTGSDLKGIKPGWIDGVSTGLSVKGKKNQYQEREQTYIPHALNNFIF